ncbi:prostaglandin E2 receptor EP3 subtype isoform 1-T1 [Porphyrio hochstetteri]
MSRWPQCQGGPNGSEPGAMRQLRGNGTGRAAESCSAVSVAFPLTMMITGIVGNALAMLLVSRSYRAKESRRKRSFLLCIGSLALTDLLGQLLTSPIVISVYLSDRTWSAVDPSGHLCTFFGFSMTVFGLCPLLIASAMAVERTLAIRAPHWYASHMKTRVTKTVLLGIWLAVFAFALLPIAGLGQYIIQWPGTWCFISTGDSDLTGNLVFASTFAILGLLSLVVTVACNLATIEALVSRCRTKATASRSSKQWGRIAMETLIQLLGIMCVLSACWSPLLAAPQRRPELGAPQGLQLLPDSRAPGLPQPDPGPLGLPAAQEDPPPQVLPSSQRCLQVLQQRVEGEIHHLVGGNPADGGVREHPPLCVEAPLASEEFWVLL